MGNTPTYTKETGNTLFTSGEYLVLANTDPYSYVQSINGFTETITGSMLGTIIKKEFRYSTDSVTFSEFQDLTNEALSALGSFQDIWFQFRYILLSGGPVTISKISINYTSSKTDPFEGYVAPNNQDQDRIYAFPITYKSNFYWEPYKMNRAVRLYKDLNLMVNNLFGHQVSYYRALPQGRSKDVFLMEYSLFDHDDGVCLKVIVPNNEFPDNKMNMGPFGVDFEMPFEVQIDRDYYQNIFGEGTGPQKRDILYFPVTNRIYEVSSSYLFRDFMNEPLYFKVTLIKWLPKSNVNNSDSVNTLEDFTNSAGKLFGELIEQEEIKDSKPQQYIVSRIQDDPVRSVLAADQEVGNESLLNYYTLVAEHYYNMASSLKSQRIKVKIDSSALTKNTKYFARLSPSSSQDDIQKYYSMKKFTFLGEDIDGLSIFSYEGGGSQIESSFTPAQIFFVGSQFALYVAEYNESIDSPIVSCDTNPAEYYKEKVVQYKATNTFPSTEDRAFSSWFKLTDNTLSKLNVSSFSLDIYSREITINFARPFLFFVGDTVSLRKTAASDFLVFGEISSVVSSTSVIVKVDQEILDYAKSNYSSWELFTDLQIQKTYPRVFLNSLLNGKGLKIELYENRHFKITMNGDYNYFSFPGNVQGLQQNKWYGLFINFSNNFKQLTVNVWRIQWDSTTNLPATTELKLCYNKTVSMTPKDVSSGVNYFLEPSFMNLTNIRLFNRVAETDKQTFILNQNIVQDAQWGIIIDNALPQSRLPYVGYTR